MQVVSTSYINDQELVILDLVKGSTLQSLSTSTDNRSTTQSVDLTDSTSWQSSLDHARDIARQHMITEAEKLRADAIIDVRFTTSPVSGNTSEILVYGTAVKFKHPHTLQQF